MRVKKMAAIFMIWALTAVCFTACQDKGEAALGAAIKKAEQVESAETETKVDMEVVTTESGREQKEEMTVSLNTVQFTKPFKSKSSCELSVAQQQIKVDMYMVTEKGKIVSYSNTNMGEGSSSWMKQEIADADDMESAMARASWFHANMFASNAFEYERREDEVLEDGKTFYVFTGVMKREQIKEMLSSAQSILGSSTDLGMTGMNMDNVLSALPDIPFTIWIRPEDETLYRVHFSMKEAMEAILKSVDKEAADNVRFDKMNMDIVFKNFNQAKDFGLPEEAKGATDFDALEGLQDE